MNYHFYLPLFALLFACGNRHENVGTSDFSNLTFSLDTVMVDPGEEIINLKNALWVSAIDPSATYLYNWDQDNTVLEKINLDKLILEEKLPFEKEGPNGVGSYVSWMTLTNENQILFSNWGDMSLFNHQGERLQSYKLQGEKFEGDTLLEEEMLQRGAILDNSSNAIFGILGTWTGKTFMLGKVDYKNKKVTKHQLPNYEKISDYSVKFTSPKMSMLAGAGQFVDRIDNKIILSNSVFNTLLIYDLSLDSLYPIDYPLKLTKISKTGKYRNEVDSEKDFKQVMTDINQEINFSKPIWDGKNQRFYRFSYNHLPRENPLEQGELPKYLVFLTIFDKDLNVLGEAEVQELDYVPNVHFVKDGKIWLYKNIDDELAFVRLSIH
jgi:hypothetical protein